MQKLAEDVMKDPDSYQYERAIRFKVSTRAIGYALKRLGITYKKKPNSPEGGSRKKIYILPKDARI